MISAFEHPFLSGLLGDEELTTLLGINAEVAAMLRFETALAEAEAELDLIPVDAAAAIVGALGAFWPDIAALKTGTARDGVVVPDLVRQIRQTVGEPHSRYVHFGATSQDVVDTAFVLRTLECLDLLEHRLVAVAVAFEDFVSRFGELALTGYTRMRPAIPIRVADRIQSWRAPVSRHLERLPAIRKTIGVIQFGGAAGTLDAFDDGGSTLREQLAARLNLANVGQWHSQRDRIVELANWLSQVTGSLGKFGQDVALMAQAGSEIKLVGGGSSSAMIHKSNPIHAEALVALARYNAAQVASVHQALVHEQERSGSGWTLEWIVLPQMLLATGTSTLISIMLVQRIKAIGRLQGYEA